MFLCCHPCKFCLPGLFFFGSSVISSSWLSLPFLWASGSIRSSLVSSSCYAARSSVKSSSCGSSLKDTVLLFSIQYYEEGVTPRSSILAWRIPWTGEPGGLQPVVLQRVGHDWAVQHACILLLLLLLSRSVVSDSWRPHRRQPTRLPRPQDSPGKNTGVGCHFLLQCTKVKSEREVSQSFILYCTVKYTKAQPRIENARTGPCMHTTMYARHVD